MVDGVSAKTMEIVGGSAKGGAGEKLEEIKIGLARILQVSHVPVIWMMWRRVKVTKLGGRTRAQSFESVFVEEDASDLSSLLPLRSPPSFKRPHSSSLPSSTPSTPTSSTSSSPKLPR